MPRLIPIDEKQLAEIDRRQTLVQYLQEAYEKRSEAETERMEKSDNNRPMITANRLIWPNKDKE